MAGSRQVRAAEAQRIEDGDRPRAHREHVAQDAADPGRCTLVGLDEGGVIVALDLEYDGIAVADVDDAGVLTRAADHAWPGGRQGLQPDLRGFVRTVLTPHRRKDAELGHIRRTPEDPDRAVELLLGQPVFGGEGRGDVAPTLHCNAPTRPSKNARPSVPPSSGSTAFSRCGIRPSPVRLLLKMPAIARAEPLKFAVSETPPSGPQ